MIKKIISSMMVICMVFSLSVSDIHAEKESEFLRLQNFIKDNPNGGTFIMEDDMLMGENYIDDNDTLYTNHQTYTIETNQHQIIMENIEITNRSEEDGWWSDEIYDMPSLIIEGDASKKPLVRIECNDWNNYQWTGVQIYAVHGPAIEIVKNETGISGDEMMLTKISSTGDDVATILISDNVEEVNLTNMVVSASGDHASAISRNNFSSDFELSISYSVLKANGEQAAAFKNIIDHSVNDGGNINHSEMKIEDVNGKCDYEKWQITSNTEIEPMKVASDVAFEDLPLPKSVDLEISRGNDHSWTSTYLSYDKKAYLQGVASGNPFCLYPSVDDLSFYTLDMKEDDFMIFCEPGEVPEITGTPSLITDEKFAIKIPRPYGAEKIQIYTSSDYTNWQYLCDEIDALDTGNHSPYISLVVNDVPAQANYLKVVIVGGYYHGKETSVEIGDLKDHSQSDENTEINEDKDDGDHGGNHGQGGGREEGNYESPKDDEKSDANDDIKKPDKPIETTQKPKTQMEIKKEEYPVIKDAGKQDFITLQLFSFVCLGLGFIMMKQNKA